MATSAAFFDLDRTLLMKASGPTIADVLRERQILEREASQLESAAFAFFDLFGETLPSILVARQGAKAAKGWSAADVRAAAVEIGEKLVEQVEPFARAAMADHQEAGLKLVLATTTPYDLVKPFADAMGFDDVLATRYRVGEDGNYDGTIDGEFVWSVGKARSVQAWARANLVELADSYAYSDSFFDVPMLSKVGHPVAVNPDPRLLAYAAVRDWPRVWFNAPPGVPKPAGIELQEVMAKLAKPELFPWVKIKLEGLSNLPTDGPVILASNHRSYLDPLLVAHAVSLRSRPARFLAKSELTDAAIVGPMVKALGSIRVDRSNSSESSMTEAAHALDGGELVAVFPQGTIPRGPDFFDPKLQGRYGAVRLALESGAPIVPVGLWGTEKAWPRSARLPYLLNLADPPTISLVVGEPYRPSTDDLDDATEELMGRIADLLPPEAAEPYEPTEAELALTYPGGLVPQG